MALVSFAPYQPQPGDGVLCHTKDVYGFFIRLAQAIKWWKGHQYNHMAIVVRVDADGTVWCRQMHRRCELTRLVDIAPGGYVKVVPCPPGVNRDDAVAYANLLSDTHYSVITIISIVFNLFLPNFLQVDFIHPNSLMCSAYVARCWEHGDWDCAYKGKQIDPFQVTPGQMDIILSEQQSYMIYVPPKSKDWPYK